MEGLSDGVAKMEPTLKVVKRVDTEAARGKTGEKLIRAPRRVS